MIGCLIASKARQVAWLTAFTQFSFSDLLNVFLFRRDVNLGATIKDLRQNQVLQTLAEPNLMAISGEPAHSLAGGEFPIRSPGQLTQRVSRCSSHSSVIPTKAVP